MKTTFDKRSRGDILKSMGKKVLIIVVAVIAIAVVALVWIKKVNSKKEPKMTIQITSSAFGQGSPIPEKYTCKGEGVNPDLKISGVPTKAKSLVLIVDDPDAPAGLWTHWLLSILIRRQLRSQKTQHQLVQSSARIHPAQ